MKTLGELNIVPLFISVFASGNSLELLSSEDVDYIKSKSFLITMNYAPIKYHAHAHIWSDKRVSSFMEEYIDRPFIKDTILISRAEAFNPKTKDKLEIEKKVNYWFCIKKEDLKGNYTIVWLLKLLEKYFSNKKVLIFGLDMYCENSFKKWYDNYTPYDIQIRGEKYNVLQKLNQCSKQLDSFIENKTMFINCNPNSKYDGFTKTSNWKDLLK